MSAWHYFREQREEREHSLVSLYPQLSVRIVFQEEVTLERSLEHRG